MHSDNNDPTSIDNRPPTINPSTSDSDPVWEIADESEAPKTFYGHFSFANDFVSTGASSVDAQPFWTSNLDQLTAQPSDREPLPPFQMSEKSVKHAARIAVRIATWKAQAERAQCFEEMIVGRLRKGVVVFD